MGKKVSGSKRSRGGGGGTANADPCWTQNDHIIRKAKQERHQQRKLTKNDIAISKLEERERRSALLTRDSKAKREEGKLRLHIKRVQRQIEKLRNRLERWDDVSEEQEKKRKIQQELQLQEEANQPKKRKGRKGPESWKLKGPARPAYEVYDFDTRYVDPHLKAHEDANNKAKRVRNIFSIYKGRFGEEHTKGIPQPECREFLSLLTQLGNLCMEAQQLKTARLAFLECMDLDSPKKPITPARCKLMRIYLEANRPDSARRLWEERLAPDDPAVWIRYSAALLEFVSWKVLEEEGSSQEAAEVLLAQAIKANVFCAYYLAFFDTFADIMEYVEEIEDATEESPLEEAIEYCNSEQMGSWQGTEGALEWVRRFILKALHSENVASGELRADDLEWRSKITEIKEACEKNMINLDTLEDGNKKNIEGATEKDNDINEEGDDDDDSDDDSTGMRSNDDDEEEIVVDLAMFAGMFETAMEILGDTGALDKDKLLLKPESNVVLES